MKKLAFLFVAVVFWGGCATKDIKNEQQQTQLIKPDMSLDRLEKFTPEQSQKRVNEMSVIQKKIQDINSEISRLIEYHHGQIDKLIEERDLLSEKLNELYNLEKEYQGIK